MRELVQDAAYRPNVNAGRVNLAAEEDLGRSVPESDDFMSVALER